MKIAIVEDEAPQRERMRELIADAARRCDLKVSIQEYCDGNGIIHSDYSGFDLILMDIDMPEMNGFEAAKIIRKTDEWVLIAFCTNLVSRALDGYAVQALDFLVKPVSPDRVTGLLEKAILFSKLRKPKTLTIKTQDETIIIPVKEVLYAETYGRKLLLHTVSRDLELRMTIVALEEQLPRKDFFRVHNACLVSLAHVSGVNKLEVTVCGKTVPVSRHKRKEFLEALTSYLGGQL